MPARKLSLLDAICIIVGTIIGAGVFQTVHLVAGNLSSVGWLALAWSAGGVIALAGSLCFAELTTRYTQEPGGDYYYLKRAFGGKFGFLFSWAAFWIIRPGNIGAMAMIFAQYFAPLVGLSADPSAAPTTGVLLALAAVVALTCTNLLGVRPGVWTQNVLTVAKLAGIAAIVGLAFLMPRQLAAPGAAVELPATSPASFWLAMVLILFAYGGWNDISFVATEVKNPQRNLLRALVLGAATVMVLYLAFNLALVWSLGYGQVTRGPAVAAKLMERLAPYGPPALGALVCVSCLGAINGMLFTSPRIYFATGRDYPQVAWLGRWGTSHDGPWPAMLCQALVTVALIALCALQPDGFTRIVVVTAPYFWLFLTLTFAALIVLRWKDKKSPFVFRVPAYPMTPLLMCCVGAAMVYASADYMISQRYFVEAGSIAGLMLVGVLVALRVRFTPQAGA